MPGYQRDRSLGEGVYFAPDDYIGVMRRVIIFVVDTTLLFVLLIAIEIVYDMLSLSDEFFGVSIPELIWFFCGWTYLTVIRASRIRTVGYWVTNSRVLNLRGNKPSLFRMTYRLLLGIFIPFTFIYDLLWAAVDEDRQTLTDRIAGTCVVRKNAAPCGDSEIHFAYCFALGFIYAYQRVSRPKHFNQKTTLKKDEAN